MAWGDIILARMKAANDPRVEQAPRRRPVKRAAPPPIAILPAVLPWSFVILGAPRTKNTGKSPRPGVVIPTQAYRNWFASAMDQLPIIRAGVVGTCDKPVTVTAIWYRDRNVGDEDRYKIALGDWLQRSGLIVNDSLIHWGGGCDRRIDRALPRTIVIVEDGRAENASGEKK